MRSRLSKSLILVTSFFYVPLFVITGIVVAFVFQYILRLPLFANIILVFVIFIGSIDLIKDTYSALMRRSYALDYIALLAIMVGIISGEYLVTSIIVLMLSGGTTLEKYGTSKAKQSLSALADRIPNSVYLWDKDTVGMRVKIDEVKVGQEVVVRKGEVVPLDGVLVSQSALADESSLTGEPYYIDKLKGDTIRSGTVNVGDVIVVRVERIASESTYGKIIKMVEQAQLEKAPFIRMTNKYSAVFTVIALILAVGTYVFSQNLERVLAVLVIATPCPLILATPIALMGGMNAAAKKRIIFKRLSSLEVLARVTTVVFDKTGTITLGRPFVKNIIVFDPSFTQSQALCFAAAIERNSLHPLAKAIVKSAHNLSDSVVATEIKETVGSGISGHINAKKYELQKVKDYHGMAIQLTEGTKQIAIFEFEDQVKEESKDVIQALQELGLKLYIFTGDKLSTATETVRRIGERITIRAELKPEEKKNGIEDLKRQHEVVAMVGDGINDAPALSYADVGMVFSNEEHTAASEAADVVFLGGDFSAVLNSIGIGKRTIWIAKQSIFAGIGISTIGMVLAAFGHIPPVVGVLIQEGVDIAVIINALRASR